MYTFKLRRNRRKIWMDLNPILADGEPGFESDTGKLKIGNGLTPWNDLGYIAPFVPTEDNSLPEHIIAEEPHPVYDNGSSLTLLYENAKV